MSANAFGALIFVGALVLILVIFYYSMREYDNHD